MLCLDTHPKVLAVREAGKKFGRFRSYKEMPQLLAALDAQPPSTAARHEAESRVDNSRPRTPSPSEDQQRAGHPLAIKQARESCGR
jgi:hypothetical protein